jgi:hypothetical protein
MLFAREITQLSMSVLLVRVLVVDQQKFATLPPSHGNEFAVSRRCYARIVAADHLMVNNTHTKTYLRVSRCLKIKKL